MKKLIFVFFVLSLWAFVGKDRTDLLAQKWQMEEMQVEGRKYSSEMIERQRQNGLVTILQFNKNNTVLVIVKTPKGKTTKRNKWQFADNQTKLIIQPEGDEPPQTFSIDKISSKKLILSIIDNGAKQIFTYKVLKD
ncbi:MAG: hypothetical protein MUE85_03140 [Microscillaceae bacterium]|nr:hypothetical protein [Microscillaceae bacterium]